MKAVCLFALLTVVFFTACSQGEEPILGSIMFTSNEDCKIYLFDGAGRDIASGDYEVGKDPFVVQMKRTGIYVLLAKSSGKKDIKEPLSYMPGTMEHYIEFPQ